MSFFLLRDALQRLVSQRFHALEHVSNECSNQKADKFSPLLCLFMNPRCLLVFSKKVFNSVIFAIFTIHTYLPVDVLLPCKK